MFTLGNLNDVCGPEMTQNTKFLNQFTEAAQQEKWNDPHKPKANGLLSSPVRGLIRSNDNEVVTRRWGNSLPPYSA
ncbi:hypothetical protein Y032_0306g2008 [Ancylostoma ceylanicum]|uniref:Uncharacterized protein n=1 Tax=Ancylostoma ceylanicum TaxID=53326 RepID=A0A016S3K4_9BILA|nr:hypothetical protein Y032_0306g2008 [Ancylostoma ceylanicum]